MTEQQFEKAVRLMVNGDKAGLREIYENYLGYIYRIVYEILQSKENAEDVTSEFLSGCGIKQSSINRGTVIKDTWRPCPGIWPSISCADIEGKSSQSFYRIWEKRKRKDRAAVSF